MPIDVRQPRLGIDVVAVSTLACYGRNSAMPTVQDPIHLRSSVPSRGELSRGKGATSTPAPMISLIPGQWQNQHRGVVVRVELCTACRLIAMLLVQRARRQRLEDQARARREELAHAQRVATLGELSASLAHEITQPLTAIAANAQAARRMLATSAAGDELNEALGDIAGDAERAGSIVRRVRAMVRKQPGERQPSTSMPRSPG
jgi:signal transduction histidine kinase